jgi:hypothetical protein
MALGACSGDLNPVRDVAVATGVGVEPKPAPDFVTQTRPDGVTYMPVVDRTQTAPRRGKSAADVKAVEAQMDQTRAANEAQAATARQMGATPAPAPATAPPASQ